MWVGSVAALDPRGQPVVREHSRRGTLENGRGRSRSGVTRASFNRRSFKGERRGREGRGRSVADRWETGPLPADKISSDFVSIDRSIVSIARHAQRDILYSVKNKQTNPVVFPM